MNTDKPTVLFVDDEIKNCKFFEKLFGDKLHVLQAYDGEQGLEIFEENKQDISLVISDQRMPKLTGSQLLSKVKETRPETVRMLSTAYSDIDIAIDAVNSGGVYRYITKPWEIAELEVDIQHALEHYELNVANASLASRNFGRVSHFILSSRLLALASMTLYKFDFNIVPALRNLITLALIGESKVKLFDSMGAIANSKDLWQGTLNNFKDTLSKINPNDANISSWIEAHAEGWSVSAADNPFSRVIEELLVSETVLTSDSSIKTLNAIIALHKHGKELVGKLEEEEIKIEIQEASNTDVEQDLLDFLTDEDLLLERLTQS